MSETKDSEISEQEIRSRERNASSDTNLQLQNLKKIYQDDEEGEVLAVDDLSLDIKDGEFLVFVGPSGCGKTTTLRSIAGLETPTEGSIRINGEDVTGREPRERDIAMVFQNYALYPHKTVRENMGFPLEVRNYASEEIGSRVEEAAELLSITDLLDRKPKQLSGGQQQRVALGRAIVREPNVFLLDEPLSNLDAKLRLQMRTELNELHQKVGKTTVYVTHDQAEAMTLSDRVAVMRDGKLQQVGPPQLLYDQPVNLFVAGFIGEPAMNFFPVDITSSDGEYIAHSSHFDIPLSKRFSQKFEERDTVPDEAILGIRPEDINDATLVDDAELYETFDALVKIVEPLGSDKFLTLVHPDTDLSAESISSADTTDAMVTEASETQEYTVRVPPSTAATEGEILTVGVDRDAIHLFDADTHENFLANSDVAHDGEETISGD